MIPHLVCEGGEEDGGSDSGPGQSGGDSVLNSINIERIAKSCQENISSVVKVSNIINRPGVAGAVL